MKKPVPDMLTEPLPVQVDRPGPDTFVSTPATEPQSVQGSIVGPPCEKCGTRVWLSPSSQGRDLSGFRVLCGPCAIREMPGIREQALAAYLLKLLGQGGST